MKFYFPYTPIGKPRQTQRDKWAKRPAVLRYRAYADSLRAWSKNHSFVLPESGMEIAFFLPMPVSWSEKKRDAMRGRAHQQKPDIDNLLKAIFDALCEEDCVIWNLGRVEKRWAADDGYFTITLL